MDIIERIKPLVEEIIFKEVGNDKKKLKEIGERYRKEILEVGGSRDESISVQKFLGRNSNNKAFLENLI